MGAEPVAGDAGTVDDDVVAVATSWSESSGLENGAFRDGCVDCETAAI